jgi:2-ketocyclohexanecarboxyl-CoA hydrolase
LPNSADRHTDGNVSYTDIHYAACNAMATVTINRPTKLNAFIIHTLHEMTDAVAAAGRDNRVGVLVITGASDRAFCTRGRRQHRE